MREHIVTENAVENLAAIVRFIGRDNPSAATRYYNTALDRFMLFPDEIYTPKRASELLPDNVHDIQVPGFKGYTLRIMLTDNAVYLVATFRPGLTEEIKALLTAHGIDEVE
jgi:plasmid stabilization system protein ParE